ncbi:MAG: HDOD domain-containing protein [Deltaproteobacteria bacterium]|nr:HDOD domain-containing protein [Deltaproteobacteria bacterium]
MGRISIEALKPGMVLAEDVSHATGRFLLGKGVELAENHLRMLKMWGVHSASVEGVSGEAPVLSPEQIDPAILKAAEQTTAERFRHAGTEHPFLKKLFQICILRGAQQMAQKQGTEPTPKATNPEPAPESKTNRSPLANQAINIETLFDQDVCLASLPNIFWEITKVTSDPRSSAVHVADVISKDTSLSAKLLKMVNSAFYGFPAKIDTISRAVMIVGSKQLSTLALGTSVIHIFRSIPSDLVDMRSFWEHSIACGIGARMFASYKNNSNAERFFVAGLLHDIGRIVLYKRFPRLGKDLLLQSRENGDLLRTLERSSLGFDHSLIGGTLLKKWKLPLVLEHSVEYHHNPLRSQYPMEAAIICLGDIVANALAIGSSGEAFVPPLLPSVWEETGLPTEILTKIVQLIDHQVADIMHTFFSEN